jgi:amino acid adenylation domain-containing protein
MKQETSTVEEQYRQISRRFNDTDRNFPGHKTIHQLFEEQVERTPTETAVIMMGKDSLTYDRLNKKSNQLARHLRDKGVGPDTIVAILLERSLEMSVGIFGIVKAGGAYLPISPTNPVTRIRQLITDSCAPVLLTLGKFSSKLDELKEMADVIEIDLENEELYQGPAENLPVINTPEDLAYVIYTSGSTGMPKGVLIQHRSLVNRLNWMQNRYPIGPKDTILQKTPYFFDVSLWEMFWWSMVGAKMCFLIPNGERFPQAIVEAVEKHQITVMHFVPSMMSVFLGYLGNSQENIDRMAGLRQVFASGEKLNVAHVKSFNDILHKTHGTRLSNLYGPTEATVDVTYFDCPNDEEVDKIPIGKSIDNTEMLILDENDAPSAIGQEGELCIAGVNVGRGYLNRPELTHDKFTAHPFKPGEKMYRTGDLAQWLPDGNIDFIGRKDHQVKIHGLRIELEEIEKVLAEHPAIQNCVTTTKKYSANVTLIVAYLIAEAEEVPYSCLKGYLKKRLPDYMIPNLYVYLPEFPLTLTGKIDRKELPEPSFS